MGMVTLAVASMLKASDSAATSNVGFSRRNWS